ncbi:unnamed protein product [Phaedon cochleariae]|uniref:Fibrinogen C-terminal domain-containing protein n=1 Tax=Phaedon cochleariae TaxID=80249 RepID=A0A9P0DMF0_PHACE|nr:unnamed protein product [Phaedon cochleariae]
MVGVYCFGIISVCVLVLVQIRSSVSVTSEPRTHYEDGHNYHHRRSTTVRSCDTEQMEYRLAKLEAKVDEKSENLVAELRESSRRIHSLEMHISEVRRIVADFSSELGRTTESNVSTKFQQAPAQRADNEKLEIRIENLSKGIQLVVAALRNLNSDITWVKKNISNIAAETKYLALLERDQRLPTTPTDSWALKNTTSRPIARNCRDIQDTGYSVSGIYKIQPEYAQKPFMVFCDMETSGGGWTYIHNRFDGSQDFFLEWNDYKTGFGNIGGEFWLGMEHIHQLTGNDLNELLVELVDFNKRRVYAHYTAFGIGSEAEGYNLKVLGGYSGNAGDSLVYHAGSRFSTKDRDQDRWIEGNCAKAHSGAWWYGGCDTSNLNGRYLHGDIPEDLAFQGMYWDEFKGSRYSLAESRMMVRPRGRDSPDMVSADSTMSRMGDDY